MASSHISIPDDQRQFIERRAGEAGFTSAEQYINHLIEEDQKRAADQGLEQLLLEGLDSGEAVPVDDQFWKNLRADAMGRVEQRKREGHSTA